MALIADPTTGTAARVETTPGALRVMLYGPDGTPLVSQIRGGAKNLRTDGGTEERDGVAILLPGTAASVIGGTATAPLRTDPTGTTAQPVTGNLGAALRVAGADVAPANPVPVAFPARQAVQVDFPTTQQVAFAAAQPVTFPSAQQVVFPSAQPISGTVNAGLRVGAADVTSANPVPVAAALQVAGAAVAAGNALPVTVIDPAPFDGFVATIDLVPATTLTSGTVYFALRNGGARSIYVRRFDLQMGFTGTAAASRSSYEIVRFTAGTPSGGTAMAPAKKITSSAASAATVLVAPAGLTMTGATFDAGPIHRVASPNQVTVSTTQDVIFTDELVLAPGEGIVVRANGAIVAGSFLTGSMGWYER